MDKSNPPLSVTPAASLEERDALTAELEQYQSKLIEMTDVCIQLRAERNQIASERDALAYTMSEIGQLAPANYQDRDDLHRALLGILKTEPPGRRCRVRAFSLREYANSLHPDHGSRGHMMSEANRLDEVADIQNRRGGL